jgi:transcriptional regulator with XRE-family HTH domain
MIAERFRDAADDILRLTGDADERLARNSTTSATNAGEVNGPIAIVRRFMADHDLSLRALARASSYDASYLSKVLRGQKPFTPSIAQRLDEALQTGGAIAKATTNGSAGVERRRRRALDEGEAGWFLLGVAATLASLTGRTIHDLSPYRRTDAHLSAVPELVVSVVDHDSSDDSSAT